jgi:hypothetical protein
LEWMEDFYFRSDYEWPPRRVTALIRMAPVRGRFVDMVSQMK